MVLQPLPWNRSLVIAVLVVSLRTSLCARVAHSARTSDMHIDGSNRQIVGTSPERIQSASDDASLSMTPDSVLTDDAGLLSMTADDDYDDDMSKFAPDDDPLASSDDDKPESASRSGINATSLLEKSPKKKKNGFQMCKSLCFMTIYPHDKRSSDGDITILGHIQYIKRKAKYYNYLCYHDGLKAEDISSHAVDKNAARGLPAKTNLKAILGLNLNYSNVNGKGVKKISSNAGKTLYALIKSKLDTVDLDQDAAAYQDKVVPCDVDDPQNPGCLFPGSCKGPEEGGTCRQETLPFACPNAIQKFEDHWTTSKITKACKGDANDLKNYDPSTRTFKVMAFSSNFGGMDNPQRCFAEWYQFSKQVDKKTAAAKDKAAASALKGELEAEAAAEKQMKKQEKQQFDAEKKQFAKDQQAAAKKQWKVQEHFDAFNAAEAKQFTKDQKRLAKNPVESAPGVIEFS